MTRQEEQLVEMLRSDVKRLTIRCENLEAYMGLTDRRLTDRRLWTWFDFGIRAMRGAREYNVVHLPYRDRRFLVLIQFRDRRELVFPTSVPFDESRMQWWWRQRLVWFNFGITQVERSSGGYVVHLSGGYVYSPRWQLERVRYTSPAQSCTCGSARSCKGAHRRTPRMFSFCRRTNC